ncbi:MAG: hypothetical protein EHJ95_03105, partial [Methanobacteriota archaeon]
MNTSCSSPVIAIERSRDFHQGRDASIREDGLAMHGQSGQIDAGDLLNLPQRQAGRLQTDRPRYCGQTCVQ